MAVEPLGRPGRDRYGRFLHGLAWVELHTPNQWHPRGRTWTKRRLHEKVCVECGAIFTGVASQLYCVKGGRCADRAKAKRRRARGVKLRKGKYVLVKETLTDAQRQTLPWIDETDRWKDPKAYDPALLLKGIGYHDKDHPKPGPALVIVNTDELEHELAQFVGSPRAYAMMRKLKDAPPLLYMGRPVFQPGRCGPLLNSLFLGKLKELNAKKPKVQWRKKKGDVVRKGPARTPR
jgi:hypothetical protein